MAETTGTLGADVRIDAGTGLLALHIVDGGSTTSNVDGNHNSQYLTFKSGSKHGDWAELWTDGSHWYAEGWTGGNGTMVKAG
jgi:hypothetical protein